MKEITEHPVIHVKLQSFKLYDSEDDIRYLRIVYTTDADPRRHTSFFEVGKNEGDVLYSLLENNIL